MVCLACRLFYKEYLLKLLVLERCKLVSLCVDRVMGWSCVIRVVCCGLAAARVRGEVRGRQVRVWLG